MLKSALTLIAGGAFLIGLVFLGAFALNAENNSGSRAVAASFILAVFIYEIRYLINKSQERLCKKIDELQSRIEKIENLTKK